jgi:hypothetical protein
MERLAQHSVILGTILLVVFAYSEQHVSSLFETERREQLSDLMSGGGVHTCTKGHDARLAHFLQPVTTAGPRHIDVKLY